MDEVGGVKAAPVTRLRRRLSVETEETKSPSAPATPTKKRTTRLAVKPQLDFIDEHAVTNSPKKTARKSISREIVEPDEKPMTPARRSARTKSNTSLASEAEEKPLTPARRSTRIKSNTSLVSEAAQSVESPRAKRAVARRNSQVGTPSASESTVTPGRRSRKKGSTSSIELPDDAALAEKPSLTTEVIVEEPETKLRKSTSEKDNVRNKDDSPTRKSPRLVAKKSRKSKSEDINEIQKQSQKQDEQIDNTPTSTAEQPRQNIQDNIKTDVSLSSANLLKDLDSFCQVQKKISNKNKSMSDIEDTIESKKRNRTKSWTTLCASSPPTESIFYSDNESKKKKEKKNSKMSNEKRLSLGDDIGSGDCVYQIAASQDKELNSNNRKSRNNLTSNKPENIGTPVSVSTKDIDVSSESNIENIVTKDTSGPDYLFKDVPSVDVKSMVFIEDSDSDSANFTKQVLETKEDQCVPVVLPQSGKQDVSTEKQASAIFSLNNNMVEKITNNDSVEPMDIDETMPENVSITVFGDKGKHSRKSSLCVVQEVDDVNRDASNKPRRKSSSSQSISQSSDDSNADVLNKKAHKPLKSVTLQADSKTEESASKSKRNSVSQCITDDKVGKEGTPAGSPNFSKNEGISGKQSQKSSIIVEQDLKSNGHPKSSSQNNKYENISNSIYDKSNLKLTMEENSQNEISQRSSIQDTDYNSKEINDETKKQSFLSNSMTHDKTENQDKSTLKLSQIKDVSATENINSSHNTNDLSKSIHFVETNNNGPVGKNPILNYLTSTPVQQKSSDKLAIQMNTSVITPTNSSTRDMKLSKNTSKRNTSIVSKSSANVTSDDDSEDSEEEDSSCEKFNLFNNEAEDAGEDYNSGDSQDENERQFEKENEITDKGETLVSEEDVSGDSDYEKDSFVVSSDEEDSELLSGSGDDLNLSDNELTLSAKSKKKYNERKLKAAKTASKEMFEARHGIKCSKGGVKNRRSRLDSTLLKSDEDILPPKKNKRMRLESTLETNETRSDTENVNNDVTITSDKEEIGYKKKKSKRLSESVSNESLICEKEITIYHQDKTQNDDPLSVQIKTEPKTPQKDLEITRVDVTDEIEHVRVDENKSMMKLNDTNDPLQTTTLQKEIESDDDSISENEEICNNYDSLLEELNKENKKQIKKSHDISLNLIKKDKQKRNKTIIDELNLTQTNISKKDNCLLAKEKSVKRVFKKLADTDESSDSFDLQLLFLDDSDSTDKGNEINIKKKKSGPEAKNSFISLKKTEAKTDIQQNMGDIENDDGGSVTFFSYTKGDLEDNTTEAAIHESVSHLELSDDAPVEVLFRHEKKKINSLTKTPSSEKKKKTPESQESTQQEQNILIAKSSASIKNKSMGSHEIGNQMLKTPVKEKKKLSLSHETIAVPEMVLKNPGNENKKKKKLSGSHEISATSGSLEQNELVVTPADTVNHPRDRKRKQSANKTDDIIESKGTAQALKTFHQLSESVLGNIKKKLKISTSIDESENQTNVPTTGVKKSEKPQTTLKIAKPKLIENQQHKVTERDTKVGKKRKDRDEDQGGNVAKVFKANSFDKIHVPRLPYTIIEQLGNMPSEGLQKQTKAKAVSTSSFIVEETRKRKNKPSDFMEETVCLNDDKSTTVKKKEKTKKPKVLPFLPTVSTSDSGFTTNFQVNVISQKMEFVAQRDDVLNFKNDYLNNKRIKKLRTYDHYRKQRNMKLSKY